MKKIQIDASLAAELYAISCAYADEMDARGQHDDTYAVVETAAGSIAHELEKAGLYEMAAQVRDGFPASVMEQYKMVAFRDDETGAVVSIVDDLPLDEGGDA